MPSQQSFKETNWPQLAESTLPLKTSGLLRAPAWTSNSNNSQYHYGGLGYHYNYDCDTNHNVPLTGDDLCHGGAGGHQFQASIEGHSKQLARKLIRVNIISLLINLLLALVAFYFSFVNNSSSTTAFAADCVLDFISSAIVLWRYYGDLNDVYMHAREQIACIYLGALFEISALGIIIKASSDIASGASPEDAAPGYDLIYLATAATIACSVLIVFKWSLYKTIRDKSILLDVINTVISTIFALTLCLMTVLSNVDSSFWYFDPVLSIVLALFMAGFGLKVIHQNFHILCPGRYNESDPSANALAKYPLVNGEHAPLDSCPQRRGGNCGRYEINLNTSLDYSRANWHKTDYSTILFV